MSEKITLGFSPCPNDTFIFDALVHHRIDTEGLEFELFLGDVEELNHKAFRQQLDITKISYHAYAHVTDNYVLLDAGSALGKGCGPLLITKQNPDDLDLNNASIAIPGKYTTANFLLNWAFPEAKNKRELLFSEIEDAVLNDEVDAGVIIHENRFTYQEKGLQCIMDLGDHWERSTQLLIPLGGIVVNRALPKSTILKVNRLLRKSIEYAFKHPKVALPYIREHAQEMEEEVMYQHIDLYV